MPLAERANATVTARTYNGGIRSTFQLPGDAGGADRRTKRLALTIGNGSAHVELESFAGTISLRRPDEARPEIECRRREKDKDIGRGIGVGAGVGVGVGAGVGAGVGTGVGAGIGRGIDAVVNGVDIQAEVERAMAEAQPEIDRAVDEAMRDVGPEIDRALSEAMAIVHDVVTPFVVVNGVPNVVPMPNRCPCRNRCRDGVNAGRPPLAVAAAADPVADRRVDCDRQPTPSGAHPVS